MAETDDWEELEEREESERPSGPPETIRGEDRASLCRKVANRVLKDNGITTPPVPVDEIARKRGFEVQLSDLAPGLDARLRVTGSRKIIELARSQSAARHRFSIAHELGHHFLNHTHGESEAAESEADIFAGELLVPGPWLRQEARSAPLVVDELSSRYQVSREVLFIAAKGARVLNRLRL